MARWVAAAVLVAAVFAVGAEARGGSAETCGTPTAGGLRFEGVGDDVTAPFGLEAGTALFHIAAEGEGYVSIWVHPALGAGDWAPVLVVSTPGPYEGTVAQRWGGPGETILAVEHDGPWSVVVEQ